MYDLMHWERRGKCNKWYIRDPLDIERMFETKKQRSRSPSKILCISFPFVRCIHETLKVEKYVIVDYSMLPNMKYLVVT